MQIVFKVKNLCFKDILKNISFEIKKSEYIGIIGPNGGGKTTLVRLLLGLEKPTSGGIDKIKCKIGFVPQRASLLDASFPATVEDIVAMGRTTKNKFFFKNSKEDIVAIEEALKKMDVYHLKYKMIGTLSGGQRQRVMCAKALASKPDVLILDEPNTGVDIESQKRFHSILKELNRDDKITIVFVTHDIESIKDDVTRVFEVNETIRVCRENLS